jgi:hypothetical protein
MPRQADAQFRTDDVRVIAFYLPQFHPIPENDEWWGPGFTEWTNVARARRLYPGHYQPRIPGELGFYDLRLPDTRAAQAALATEYGVSAFCYWHYWFGGGRRLLERPFAEVLTSGQPDFPFCLGWANETWSGIWHGVPRRVLIEQTYPCAADYRAHFDTVLPAFTDPRYVRIDGRPLFYVFNPAALPEPQRFLDLWRGWAVDEGLPGIFFVGRAGTTRRSTDADFDAFVVESTPITRWPAASLRRRHLPRRLARKLGFPRVSSYQRYSESMPLGVDDAPCFPMVVPGWDNTPRSGSGGIVLHGERPEIFEAQVARAVAYAFGQRPSGPIVFVKSWNEWAEGNYLEPDRRYGRAFLQALRDGVSRGCSQARVNSRLDDPVDHMPTRRRLSDG